MLFIYNLTIFPLFFAGEFFSLERFFYVIFSYICVVYVYIYIFKILKIMFVCEGEKEGEDRGKVATNINSA